MVLQMMFSICIPVYNAEKFLNDCVDSVLNQSYQSFEIILVDDGSKDGSFSICNAYAQMDKRIRCFTKKNEGQLATRLFAFSKACGNVIVCLDSDDYLESNALELLNKYFVEFKCDCIYFGWRRFSDTEKLKQKNTFKLEVIEDCREKYIRIFEDSNCNSMSLKAFKKQLLPKSDYSFFYKLRMAEDLVQTVGIIKNSKKVVFVPEILYNYRINPKSVTENVCVNNYDVDDIARMFVYDFLKKENVFFDKDWSRYGSFCCDLFFNDLIRISHFPNSIQDRIFLLKKKRESTYYIKFISLYSPSRFFRKICMRVFDKKIMLGVLFLSAGLNLRMKMNKFFH